MPLPQDFEVLGAGLPERAARKFTQGVEVLRAGLAAGAVRNVELDDAKRAIGLAFEKAWESEVAAPFFHAGRYDNQPEPVRDLYWNMSASSLHSAISMQKKLDRAGIDGEAVSAMRRVLAEALPLAQAVVELKPMIVKGRAPNPNPAPPKEHKNGTGTCSCCFSGIAITDHGKMAHHGYRRPGWGFQTSSCSGTRFPPLEVSTEGLEWLINATRERIEKTARSIEEFPRRDEIRWTAQTRRGAEPRVSHRGDADWDRVARACRDDLQRQHEALSRDVELLEGELEKWRMPESEPNLSL